MLLLATAHDENSATVEPAASGGLAARLSGRDLG
jgi:hypothetical protein